MTKQHIGCKLIKGVEGLFTEKRSRARLRSSWPKEHWIDQLGGIHDLQHDDEILDMSTTGACIRTSTRHKPGKRFIFEINLSDAWEKITRLARVRWIRPDDREFRVGIKFI